MVDKRTGNAGASLNHEADLSDGELDGVVGGSSVSGLKKGIELVTHSIENAAYITGAEASQSAAGNAGSTAKHRDTDQTEIDERNNRMHTPVFRA